MKFLLFSAIIFITCSCNTYTLTVNELQKELSTSIPTKESDYTSEIKTSVIRKAQKNFSQDMECNGIRYIKSTDQKGDSTKVRVYVHTFAKIYDRKNKLKTAYFQTLCIKDGILTGYNSIYLKKIIAIPVDSISSIKIVNNYNKANFK